MANLNNLNQEPPDVLFPGEIVEPEDSAESGRVISKPTTYQCPNCNGILYYSAKKGKLVCLYCKEEFDESEHKKVSIPVSGSAGAEKQETAHVEDVEGFLARTTWGGAEAEELPGARGYSCPSCGASVVADQSVAATNCPYCGNNLLVSGIATTANLPTKVIPFSITKEQAQACLREHFKKRWYLPRKFEASLEHIRGVYVPYYIYNMDVVGRGDFLGDIYPVKVAQGIQETVHDIDVEVPVGDSSTVAETFSNILEKYKDAETSFLRNTTKAEFKYIIQRAGHACVRVPAEASSRMPDGHMDAIAPFSFPLMRDFSPGYVAGYIMEVPDEPPAQFHEKASGIAKEGFARALARDAVEVNVGEHIYKTIRSKMEVTGCTNDICVLPVWIMHCAWEEHQMLFAVNGETGKCVGDLPVDNIRRCITQVLTFIILLGFLSPYCGIIFGPLGILISILCALLGADGVDKYFMQQMKSVSRPNTSISYEVQDFKITHSWRSYYRYNDISEAIKVLDMGETRTSLYKSSYSQSEPWRVSSQDLDRNQWQEKILEEHDKKNDALIKMAANRYFKGDVDKASKVYSALMKIRIQEGQKHAGSLWVLQHEGRLAPWNMSPREIVRQAPKADATEEECRILEELFHSGMMDPVAKTLGIK